MYHLTPHYQYQRLISQLSLYGIPPNLYKLYPLSASLSLSLTFSETTPVEYHFIEYHLSYWLLSFFPPLILVSLSLTQSFYSRHPTVAGHSASTVAGHFSISAVASAPLPTLPPRDLFSPPPPTLCRHRHDHHSSIVTATTAPSPWRSVFSS